MLDREQQAKREWQEYDEGEASTYFPLVITEKHSETFEHYDTFPCQIDLAKVPEELQPVVEKMAKMRASTIINLHSANGELDPITNVENIVPQQITPEAIIGLARVADKELKDKKYEIKGAAAVFPKNGRNSGETIIDIEIDGDKYRNNSVDASGIAEGDIGLSQRIEQNDPNTIVTQVGIFEETDMERGLNAPLIYDLERPEHVTVGEILEGLGNVLQHPCAIQLLVMDLEPDGDLRTETVKAEANVHAVGQLPETNMTIQEAGRTSLRSKKIEGPFLAFGIKSESPYSKNGHLHGYALDQTQGGGHLATVKGRIIVAVSPVEKIDYVEYSPDYKFSREIRDGELAEAYQEWLENNA